MTLLDVPLIGWVAMVAAALAGYVIIVGIKRPPEAAVPEDRTPHVPFGVVRDRGDAWEWEVTDYEMTNLDRATFLNLSSFVRLTLLTEGVISADGRWLRSVDCWVDPLAKSHHLRWSKEPIHQVWDKPSTPSSRSSRPSPSVRT